MLSTCLRAESSSQTIYLPQNASVNVFLRDWLKTQDADGRATGVGVTWLILCDSAELFDTSCKLFSLTALQHFQHHYQPYKRCVLCLSPALDSVRMNHTFLHPSAATPPRNGIRPIAVIAPPAS
jgi:hypothetical protein